MRLICWRNRMLGQMGTMIAVALVAVVIANRVSAVRELTGRGSG